MSMVPASIADASGGIPRAAVWQAGIVAAASVLLLALAVWASLHGAMQDRNGRAVVSARLVERGLTRTLESVETTLNTIAASAADGLRDGDAGLAAAKAQMREALRFAPHLRQIVIAQGARVMADSNGTDEGADLALARIGLAAVDDSAKDGVRAGGLNQGLRIGDRLEGRFLPTAGSPPARGGGRSFIPVGLTVPMPAGGAALTVVAALNASYLDAFFADVGVGEAGAYALTRLNGSTLLGEPATREWTGLVGPVVQSGADERLIEEGHAWWPHSTTAVRLSARYPVAVVLQYALGDTTKEWTERNGVLLLVLVTAAVTVVTTVGLLLRGTIRRARLQEQVRLLFHAVDQSPMAVLVTDADGRIRYVNPAFTVLMGYTPDEVTGRNPRLLNSGGTAPETFDALWKTILTGRPWRGEFLNRAKDGTILRVASTVSPLRNAAGETTHYVGMLADITEAKRIEQERETLLVRLDQAHGALQRFAEVSAHHLQEPSRRLVSFAQRLKARLAGRTEDEDVALSLSIIEEQAARLRNLVRDIQLYLAADQPLAEERTVDVNALLGSVLGRLAAPVAASGTTVIVDDLPSVTADASRLQEVFTILIGNAVQHRREDRPLTIRVSGGTEDGRVRFRVEDDGPGIPEAYRERVFRVFERLCPKPGDSGTGIGLAIVRRIVETAGGTVVIEETPGGGTTVVVDLPVSAARG